MVRREGGGAWREVSFAYGVQRACCSPLFFRLQPFFFFLTAPFSWFNRDLVFRQSSQMESVEYIGRSFGLGIVSPPCLIGKRGGFTRPRRGKKKKEKGLLFFSPNPPSPHGKDGSF